MEQNVSGQSPATRPLVSVILATYNEARSIDRCMASILNQQTTCRECGDFALEVLTIDGMSDDGTRAILESFAAADPRVRVIDNARRRTPFAFNLGLQHARGEFVCIFGAHSLYRRDYIAVCLGELLQRGAAACGGRVVTVPAGKALGARLSAWTLSHPFGSSPRSFRTQSEGPVDTVNYPVMRRDLALAAGGYDEELTRNQDNDLNQKLRATGRVLWCTWKTHCQYFPQATVKDLLRYGFRNGYWNAVSLARNPASMAPRHFVPLAFVVCLLGGGAAAAGAALLAAPLAGAALMLPAAVLGAHLCLGAAAAVQVAVRERSPAALSLPAVFLGFHFAYGWGTLMGLARPGAGAHQPRRPPQERSIPSAN